MKYANPPRIMYNGRRLSFNEISSKAKITKAIRDDAANDFMNIVTSRVIRSDFAKVRYGTMNKMNIVTARVIAAPAAPIVVINGKERAT